MAFGVLDLGVTLVRLSDRNLGRPPFQTSVVMTQGGCCVTEQYEGCLEALLILRHLSGDIHDFVLDVIDHEFLRRIVLGLQKRSRWVQILL